MTQRISAILRPYVMMGALFGSLILIAVLIRGFVVPDAVPGRIFSEYVLNGLLIAISVFILAKC